MIGSILKIQKAKESVKKEDETFLVFLTYLFCMTTGNVSEVDLFKHARNSIYKNNTSAFKEAYNLGVGWAYGLGDSCRYIGDRLSLKKNLELGQLLIKISQLVKLGDTLNEFFENEWDNGLKNFTINYERNLESQKLFLEMFYTMMSTSAFLIAAVSILAMLMGEGSTEQLMILAYVAITSGLSVFLYMMYKMFPRDPMGWPKTNHIKFRIKLYVSLLASGAIGITLFATNMLDYTLIVSIAFIPLLYPGYLARKQEARILELNQWYPGFILHIGKIYETIGSLSQTLDTVLRSDYGILQQHLLHLRNRIKNRIDIGVSLELLSQETDSYLIGHGNYIVSSSLEMGAKLSRVGDKVGAALRTINEMRGKRRQNARTFEITVIMLHVLSLAVFGLMSQLTGMFTDLLGTGSVTGSAFSIAPMDPNFIKGFLPILIITNSVISGFAVKVAQGGVYKTVIFNIALLGIIGGICTYGVIQVLEMALQDSIIDLDAVVPDSLG